jgi:hypothetical protein
MELIDLRPHATRRDQIVPYDLCLKHEAFVTPVSPEDIGGGKGSQAGALGFGVYNDCFLYKQLIAC